MTYKETPMSETQRRFGRFEVSLPSELVVQGNTNACTINNISVGGFFAQFTDPILVQQLMIETVVSVTIPLTQQNHTITSQARVTWRNEQGIGFAFDRLKPIDVWSIIQLTRVPQDAFHLSVGQSIEEDSDIDQELG
jgi:hypothetical protein